MSGLPRPSLAELVRVFAKIGLLSFGGPAGQIALMHRMIVDERGWLTEDRFLAALNYCMLLPGPEAQQLATYIGWHLGGVRGGLVAGILFVLPGFMLITAVAAVYAAVGELPAVEALFFGLKAAVLAIVVEALMRIGRRALKDGTAYALAALAFVAIYVFSVPFPAIVLAAALFGFWRGRTASAPSATGSVGPSWSRSFATATTWILVWVALPFAVILVAGADSLYPTLAAFFSTMAMVTFGGAYAVLAYVAQAAVETYGWLAPEEMLDALAMAETTPGPLILVLVFVGFLAGYRAPLPFDPLTGGLVAAVLTAWVTFIPSFLWIFTGAPYLDRVLASPRLKSALAAVTAAVVGVILNLTVWFALHVLFRDVSKADWGLLSPTVPDVGSIDVVALALSTIAAFLIFRVKAGIVPTLAVTAALGIAALSLGLIGQTG